MRARSAIAVIVGVLGLAGQAQAVTLVTPQGQPVGGKWQLWADQSKVPTVPGTLVFTTDASACGGPPACSWGSPWFGGQRETAVGDGVLARKELYFELGHQFDWELLTWADRRYLERHWRILDPAEPYPFATIRWWHWLDSAGGIQRHGEDGLEAVFAAVYEDCAQGENDRGASITMIEPAASSGVHQIPQVIPKIDTCTYLRRVIGRR